MCKHRVAQTLLSARVACIPPLSAHLLIETVGPKPSRPEPALPWHLTLRVGAKGRDRLRWRFA